MILRMLWTVLMLKDTFIPYKHLLKEHVSPQSFRCLNTNTDHVSSLPSISACFLGLIGLAQQYEYNVSCRCSVWNKYFKPSSHKMLWASWKFLKPEYTKCNNLSPGPSSDTWVPNCSFRHAASAAAWSWSCLHSVSTSVFILNFPEHWKALVLPNTYCIKSWWTQLSFLTFSKQTSLPLPRLFSPEGKPRAYLVDQVSKKVESASLLQKAAGIPSTYPAFIQQISG